MVYADSNCTHTEEYSPEHVYIFSGKTLLTKRIHSVRVPAQGLFKYRQGSLIQHAFPNMSANDREFLLNGMI